MENDCTRYGRTTNGHKKNTLITREVNKIVYFGISRCDIEADNFSKGKGVELATQRCNEMQRNQEISLVMFKEVWMHKSGLFGAIKPVGIPALIKYFDNIDEIMKPEWVPRTDYIQVV